jgi:hypothetical protein
MSRVVHARLDAESHRIMQRLRRRLGSTDSEIIRRAIRVLAEIEAPKARRRIVGLGKFASGCDDLASNPARLEAFGR